MNWRRIRAIAEKDLDEVRKNRIAVVSSTILAVVFSIILPVIMTQAMVLEGGTSSDNITSLIPPALQEEMGSLTSQQQPVVLFLGYLLAPLFLILPLILASVIAAEAFVGEKERKTLEALLHTPATDAEMFTAKVVASAVPAVLYAWGNFVVYTVVVNVASYPIMQRIWFPTPIWLPIMFWIVPAIALMGTAATVLISSKVSTFMEAYQASGGLVVVVLGLLVAQISGILFLSPLIAIVVGSFLFAADAFLIWFGIEVFSRERLVTRM
ncbi:MAG: ABC transporter permease subunit [Methanomicrobiales archaeon]|nr:ABC transporter permease subunit [Methanomicrobiales archaeon]